MFFFPAKGDFEISRYGAVDTSLNLCWGGEMETALGWWVQLSTLSTLGDGSTAVNIAKISLVQLAGTCAKITIEQLSLYNFNCGALLVQVDEASRRQDVDHGLYHGPHFAIFSLPMTCHVRCGHASLYDMFIFRKKTCVPTKRTLCSYSWIPLCASWKEMNILQKLFLRNSTVLLVIDFELEHIYR